MGKNVFAFRAMRYLFGKCILNVYFVHLLDKHEVDAHFTEDLLIKLNLFFSPKFGRCYYCYYYFIYLGVYVHVSDGGSMRV